MMTVLAIALLIMFAGLVVAMAVTPMVVETEGRRAPAPQRPVTLQRPVTVPAGWEDHQHAA